MGASAARMAKRSGHAVSVGQDARRERPATGHWQARASWTREDHVCTGSEVHAQVAAGGVAGGLLTGEPFERPREIARGDVAVELDLHGMLRG